MAPCSCGEMSRLEIREAIALGVAGIQEMSMALGLDCASCHGWTPVDEAPQRAKDPPPVPTYGRNGHLPAIYLRRN